MKRIISMILVLVMIAATLVVFSSCGGNNNNGKTVVRIGRWASEWEKEVFEAWTAEFESENPDIDIVWEWNAYNSHFDRIKTDLLSQMAADIIFVNHWGWYPYRNVDMFVDLSTVPELQECFDNLIPEAQNAFVFNGKTIGMPIGFVTRVPVVNTTLFENAGVEIPTDRTSCFTPSEFVELITPVMNHPANNVELGLNITLNDLLYCMLASVGTPMFDENNEIHIDNPTAIAAVKEFQDFVYGSGIVIPYQQSTGSGKYGSVTDCLLYKNPQGDRLVAAGYSNPGNLLTPTSGGVSVATIPGIKATGGVDTIVADTNVLVVPTFSKVKDEAYRVIKWFMEKENQLKYVEFGDLPCNAEAFEEVFTDTDRFDPEIYSAYKVGMDNIYFGKSTSSRWQAFIAGYFKRLCEGTITPEQFCKEVTEKGPQYFEEE
ncbi:MAG: carbohydrate ABC transporter substrate-binding protein [Clostridia bacterium]|nr:carbohydrate ABC transporter substrate-binding protein [Clostridia bacterium]